MRGLRFLVAGLLLALALVFVACGEDDDDAEEAPPAVEGGELAATADEEGACQEVDEPKAKEVKLERPKLKPVRGIVTFATSCGTFTVRLEAENSPKTAASVRHLVQEGVYDNTPFHRVMQNFIVQGGDPTGEGTGGPGYNVDEPPPEDTIYTDGLVAMAKTEADPPGRSGSQFFIVTAPADAGLEPIYAVAGEVASGFEAVERIEALGPLDSPGPPSQPVIIEKATFTPDD